MLCVWQFEEYNIMITWMQKHKKWLVITIWISTIAFVGAGFVGWGSYDFSKSAGAVAVVGDRKVSYEEFQREYSNLYQQYSQIFGEQFNQEMAKQLKLSDVAYKMVIEKNLIMSFGDELGLSVTNEEVAKELVQIPAFIKDGKFDKTTYLKVLTQNRTNAKDFEATIKRNILLQKVEKLFALDIQDSEIKNLSQLLFAQDRLSVKVLDAANIDVKIDESKMKSFWEKNKNKYLSQNSYELAFNKLLITDVAHPEEDIKNYYNKFKNDFKKEDGKLKNYDEAKEEVLQALNKKAAKKKALKAYLKLKKGESEFKNTAVFYEDKLNFSSENIEKIKGAKVGTVIKPFVEGNEYVTVKVLQTFLPKPLSYENAKQMVRNDYTNELRQKALEDKVNAEVKDFTGKDIGYVSRDSFTKIPGLNPTEAQNFLNQLFSSVVKKGDISLGNKVVVYEITDSKLGSFDETKLASVKTTLKQLQDAEMMTNLVKRLETRYEVQRSQTEQKEN
jgi:peptidyl-prolyl cis-trans isomerase D